MKTALVFGASGQIGLPLLTGTLGTLIGVAPVFWLVSATLMAGSYGVREKWRAPRPVGASGGN